MAVFPPSPSHPRARTTLHYTLLPLGSRKSRTDRERRIDGYVWCSDCASSRARRRRCPAVRGGTCFRDDGGAGGGREDALRSAGSGRGGEQGGDQGGVPAAGEGGAPGRHGLWCRWRRGVHPTARGLHDPRRPRPARAPTPAQQEDELAIKSFKLSMERFLQTARPQSSWSHAFHERMLKTSTILSQDKYNQYVEALKYYTENSGGTITKTQQACVGLAHNLLNFLQIHKMDTDSALIGLSPSNVAMDACTEQERYLMHQVAGWKTLESSSLKADVRKTADKVMEWTTINKGDLLIIRKSRGEHVYARYSGEKSQTQGMGSSLSVWVDVFESIVERVPLNLVYFISPYTKQAILSRKEQQFSKSINHPAPNFFKKLDTHAQNMTFKYLESLGVEWDLIMNLESNSLYMQFVESGNLELGTLANVKRILSESLGEEAQTEYLEKVHSMADRKARKYIQQLDVMKIFLPDKKSMIEQILLFPSDIKQGEGRRLAKFISKVDVAFDTLCLQYLGRKKDELNDRILLHIERETTFFLETQGFDFTAVPDNYIEHPPSSIAVVSKNLALLKALFVRESPMYQLASRVREAIQEMVFNFLRNCYIAILYGLGRGLPNESEALTPEKYIENLKEIMQEIKGQATPNVMREKYRRSQNLTEMKLTLSISDEKIRKCSALISELDVLHAMTIEHEVKEKNVNDVTFGGLVINVFVRLCEEMKTVLEHWDKDSKEKAYKEREAREREAREAREREEVAEFKERLSKSERDFGNSEQFKERLTKSYKDLNHASGNWVAATRRRLEPSTKEPYLEGKGKRGNSEGNSEDGSPRSSSYENSPRSSMSENGKGDDQNGRDENPLSKSVNLPIIEEPVVEVDSRILLRAQSKRELPPVPPRRPRPLPELPPTPDNFNKEKEKEKDGLSTSPPIIIIDSHNNTPPSNNSTNNSNNSNISNNGNGNTTNHGNNGKNKEAKIRDKNRLTMLTKGLTGTSVRSLFGSKSDLGHHTPKMETKPVDPLQLHAAATQNNVNLVYELISQGTFDINIQDKQGWTALHCAACNLAAGQATAMEMMILLLTVHGIDTNIPNDSQATPLHILAKTSTAAFSDMSSFLPSLDLMMIKGASLTQVNSQGEIPLHLACLSGNAEVVRFLLKAGSDPNAQTTSHQSCLHYATHRGHTDIVRLLLEYGANPNYASPDGTALVVAERNKYEEIIQLLSAASC